VSGEKLKNGIPMTLLDTPVARRRRVLIVEDDSLVGIGLRAHLEKLGHEVIGEASKAGEAAALFLGKEPDIVLMDIRLDGIDGIELARQLLQQRRCPMVIISAFSDNQLIERASAVGVFGYLIKPVSAESLRAQIEVAVSRFEEHEKVLAEKAELAQQLETRKLVEKAKGIFMKRLNLDEAEAHKRLQLESQKRRIGLAELCRKIIESEDILGGT
jgi:two-component system, response regulator PdtaR